jgi:hypothetical protein
LIAEQSRGTSPLSPAQKVSVCHVEQLSWSSFANCSSRLPSATDLQNVNITLRILYRPKTTALPRIYREIGVDYDERVLPSIGNEVLKAVVVRAVLMSCLPWPLGEPIFPLLLAIDLDVG